MRAAGYDYAPPVLDVADQILARADGVPLFIEELTKAVIESNVLVVDAGRYVLKGPLPTLQIPPTLHDSLMSRLDRLQPVREVAQIGAAIGREFPYLMLEAVARIPIKRLQNALEQLLNAGLKRSRRDPSIGLHI